METIWKILCVSAIFSIAIFLQILSCFAFDNNWCAAHTTHTSNGSLHGCAHPTPRDPTAPRVALMPGCR